MHFKLGTMEGNEGRMLEEKVFDLSLRNQYKLSKNLVCVRFGLQNQISTLFPTCIKHLMLITTYINQSRKMTVPLTEHT